MLKIRKEEKGDESQIRIVNELAFGQIDEADLVDLLRINCNESISLVAEFDNKIVGHILFTPALIEAKDKQLNGMGLAPMAVLPEHQSKGIGSELVKSGLELIMKGSCQFIIVLGHPKYYPRFGFVKASECNIKSDFHGIPDEAFMILVLDEKSFAGISGTAKYRKEFSSAV
ncbi:MAG: N-acetyltransferase [Bacteroidetes bacterium]|nr:N-acetyltransferase [Bacteroidota bacterium]MBU1680120.1 N-acetyltransferase [Bacteroidota bacterium]MBU2505564.1 N-acetyltransferase [Bacteroidota bacterium]